MPQAHVARQMGLSRGTVAKWWHRWLAEGEAGLVDRSSRPRRCPRRTDARLEERVCRLRRSTRRGPVYLGARTGLSASTVWRILKRNGLNRLSWIDRPTGRVIRRYERSAPGELVHLDIKKVGKIPPGGGWRVHGRGSQQAKRANRSKRRPVGYTYLHVAIDDYSRVAYVEAHDNETAKTLVGFWRRAQDWFWSNDMRVDEILTDNGPNFVSDAFAEVLDERRIVHLRTRPYRPQTNGKAERFNRTLADEFLYNYRFRSESERRIRLKRWDHDYNCHRHHTAPPSATRPHHVHTTSRELTTREEPSWLAHKSRLSENCEMISLQRSAASSWVPLRGVARRCASDPQVDTSSGASPRLAQRSARKRMRARQTAGLVTTFPTRATRRRFRWP